MIEIIEVSEFVNREGLDTLRLCLDVNGHDVQILHQGGKYQVKVDREIRMLEREDVVWFVKDKTR